MFFAFETVEIFCRLHYNLSNVMRLVKNEILRHSVVQTPQVSVQKAPQFDS